MFPAAVEPSLWNSVLECADSAGSMYAQSMHKCILLSQFLLLQQNGLFPEFAFLLRNIAVNFLKGRQTGSKNEFLSS